MSHTNRPVRAAFLMEQAMGHITHYHNLREAAADQDRVAPYWLPIAHEVHGAATLMPVLRSNWAFRAAWRARWALRSARARERIDVLFFNTQLPALFSSDVMRRVPAIVTLDATPINFDQVGAAYGHRPARDTFLDRQKYQLNRRVFHAADRLVSWSEWARRSLIDDYGVSPHRVLVLAPGASASYFEIGERRSAGEVASRTRAPHVLFVGNDFNRKGGPQLLEALGESLNTGACELDLVTTQSLPPRANVRVHHHLPPNSSTLQDLFANADLFALPSLGDCLALVLMEAAAAGLPVVTTDVGALGEAVVPEESGCLLPAGDTRRLRAALEALLADPGRRRAMGRASSALARRKFDARQNNQRVFELIYDLGTRSRELGRAL